MARVEPTRLRARPFALRFDDEVREQEFRREYNHAALPEVRVVSLLGIAIYGGFGVLDTQYVPGQVSELFLIRFGVVCPYIALILVLSYRPWFERVQQLAVCSAIVVAGWGIALMPVVAPVPYTYAATGAPLILIFVFTILRVRFPVALLTAAIVIAGYEAGLVAADVSTLDALYHNFFLLGFFTLGAFTSHTLERLRRKEYVRERELEQERARSDALLHNILPEEIAGRLRVNPIAIADAAEQVTVLFADVVGFTPLAESAEPRELVAFLDGLFTRYDELCERHGVEKIKTIGDAYMAVAGLPKPHPDHAAAIVELALDMRAATAEMTHPTFGIRELRIGISSGPVVAGVIGQRKFAYDLWGDTVNTASRMESQSEPGVIQISDTTRHLLGHRYRFGDEQVLIVKGKGPTPAWHVLGRAEDMPAVVEPV